MKDFLFLLILFFGCISTFLTPDLNDRNRNLRHELDSKIEEASSLAESLEEMRKKHLDGQIANERHSVATARLKVPSETI